MHDAKPELQCSLASRHSILFALSHTHTVIWALKSILVTSAASLALNRNKCTPRLEMHSCNMVSTWYLYLHMLGLRSLCVLEVVSLFL